MNDRDELNDLGELNDGSELNDRHEPADHSEPNDRGEPNGRDELNDIFELNDRSELNDRHEPDDRSEPNDNESNDIDELNSLAIGPEAEWHKKMNLDTVGLAEGQKVTDNYNAVDNLVAGYLWSEHQPPCPAEEGG